MTHDCPGPECHPYPTFDDDPARWGLLPEPPMAAAELATAAELEAWGPDVPYASYAEWAADIGARRTGGRTVTGHYHLSIPAPARGVTSYGFAAGWPRLLSSNLTRGLP